METHTIKYRILSHLAKRISSPCLFNLFQPKKTFTKFAQASKMQQQNNIDIVRLATISQATKMQQQSNIDIGRFGTIPFSTSNNSALMKQILSTHSPHGLEVDVRPILPVIKDVLQQANLSMDSVITSGAGDQADALVEKTAVAGFDGMLKEDASIINKISCELTRKCSGGNDAHSTAMTIFNNLSNYSWDAKVVISLAAFAANYGEFWLMAQLSATNPLAKSVSVLKQLSSIRAHASSLKSRVDPINNLLHNAILKLIDCIFQFKKLPPQYISHERPPAPLATAMAHFPAAAYWTIRSIVVCSTQTTSLLGMSNEQATESVPKQLTRAGNYTRQIKHPEGLELSSLAEKLTNIQVGIEEVLKRKTAVLLISDLDHIAEEELFALKRTYDEAKTKLDLQYEIVWIPVVNRSTDEEASRKKFEQLQARMPWYTVVDPWLLDPVVIRYMKEEWHFSNKILVALDPQAFVTTFMVWGNVAYPFTVAKEESLWKEETWKLELLVDSNYPDISAWISQGKHICLYGGADLEWVQNFTAALKDFAKTAEINLEMVYVGKSKANERVKAITSTITAEKLSHCLPYPISYFWTQLESMWYSGTQHCKTAENDRIFQEVSVILSFDGSEQGWAVISNESTEMARANSDTILKIIKEFKLSAEETKQKGFVPALNEIIKKLPQPHHCNKLLLPWTSTGIPEKVQCADCARPMEKYFMYRCCTD
ncbi:protein SIEVE ELEMENT OCCLUSION A-like [Rhododendron vialii]|uniref:protein SIEVE ELEMENT OCCLUSION A-like n=1 Tax=Rhododendron vialii TaxID=182163 RepID=UPI00265E58C6|nr:protein SIEVE ELEMENT OCCLUSION A-like [Rhododendron vialii]